jgi:hypothetical protein
MPGHLSMGLHLLLGAAEILAAIAFFIFWKRTRFWLPKYAHVLAAIGLAVGIWSVSSIPSDAPIGKQGPIVRFLAALILPAMVYFFFVFYGGQRAAYARRFPGTVSCPYCRMPVIAFHTGRGMHDSITSYADKQCPHCGQLLQGSLGDSPK